MQRQGPPPRATATASKTTTGLVTRALLSRGGPIWSPSWEVVRMPCRDEARYFYLRYKILCHPVPNNACQLCVGLRYGYGIFKEICGSPCMQDTPPAHENVRMSRWCYVYLNAWVALGTHENTNAWTGRNPARPHRASHSERAQRLSSSRLRKATCSGKWETDLIEMLGPLAGSAGLMKLGTQLAAARMLGSKKL